jgi:hypothetical protein
VRLGLGYATPARVVDECAAALPVERRAVYLVDSERSPVATALRGAGAPLVARVPRRDDAFLVLGPPPDSALSSSSMAVVPPARCSTRGSHGEL